MDALVKKLKAAWILSWAGLFTLIFFLPIILTAFLSPTGNLPFVLARWWARLMILVTGARPQVRGKENIRPGQSYIIISNHQSHFDILALVTMLGVQFRWVIKQELRKVPLFGYALYTSKNIFIDRSNREHSVRSINEGLDRLPPGASVIFFAEGTRSVDGKVGEFKKGGFIIALEKGLPILPVTVNGSSKVLPKHSLVFYPGPIEVVVNDPIPTRDYSFERLDELIRRTRDAVISNFNPDYPVKGNGDS